MHQTLAPLSALLIGLGLSTAVHSAPFHLTLPEQPKVELKQAPEKIAVYDLAILDTLNALNIDAAIVPETTFQGSLSKYQQAQYLKAGTLFEPDLKLLKQAQPELIFVGGRSAKTAEQLQNIAPTLHLSANTDHYMSDLTARTQVLAAAFNKEKIAQQKLYEIAQLQQALKAKTKGKTALMLFVAGDNWMPHAANDRFGFAYELSGLKSVLPLSEKTDAPRPATGSPEALALAQKNAKILKNAVKQAPDYLIVLDRGAVNTQQYAAKEKILSHSVLGQSQAVKNGKVIFVNADAWYLTGAGLDNTQFMLKELAQAIP
ncbi:MAG: ABC transporter substrate-binding protein [Acinetobacter sp.]